METVLTDILTLGAEAAHGAHSAGASSFLDGLRLDGPAAWVLIPLLPLVGALLCLAGSFGKVASKLPAYLAVATIGLAFAATLGGLTEWLASGAHPTVVSVYEWIGFQWGSSETDRVSADFGLYMDGLSWLWMTFVMMLGGLIALYASEYMSHDVGRGYGRFFAAFCLFVFSMSCLVMGDNLFLLYLGWEGVGLCSYLLIGYFYKKPEAVAAAKKAFIVNRIGDLGLALGVFLIYTTFGTVEYTALFQLVEAGVDGSGDALAGRWETWGIPCLLMIGAFGKSAQLPLYVWLPDAMEGPTPVSALIHAATMVTAGIYLIARMFPLFTLDPNLTALNVVAWVGALTALLAATIGMAQFDIKRIMAYSTVSQLGYMFAGLGVLSSTGAVYHVFTHAFFKAMLFLACGAVMHGFAGQLDLRKLSGLWSQKGWKITTIAMFVGCLNLAGVPFMAGYWSKDIILAESFTRPGMQAIGWILLFTAGLTAYYTFRVFFRVFVGPAHHEPGDEVHDHEHDEAGHHAGGEESLHDTAQHGDHHADHFHPHPPQFAMNLVLGTLTVLTLLASTTYFLPSLVKPGSTDTGVFIKDFVVASSADQKVVHKAYYDTHGAHTGDEHHGEGETHSLLHDGGTELALIPAVDAFDQATDLSRAAAAEAGGRFAAYPKEKAHHASLFGFDPHKVMYYVSGVVGLIGILIAAFLHGPKGIAGLMIGGRTTAAEARSDAVAAKLGPIPKWAEHKWYVDEFYDLVIVGPLRLLSYVFQTIDKLLVDGLVNLAGILPRGIAHALRPAQNGILHTYATGMAFGIALVLVAVWLVVLANGGS